MGLRRGLQAAFVATVIAAGGAGLALGPASALAQHVGSSVTTAALPSASATTTKTATKINVTTSSTGTTSTGTAGTSTTGTATGARQAAADAAAAYATSRGWETGIAVIDMETGDVTTAGDATGLFPTESTVKVMLAANLLATGQMSDDGIAAEAYQMVTASDDDAANDLYSLAGGDDVVSWAAARYGIADLGTGPINGAGMWGSTQVTPLGMARFLAAAAQDSTVGPWLTQTMSDMKDTAADGTAQDFGIAAVATDAAVKQGWGGDTASGQGETTPSIGYVDGRYVVVIYTLSDTTVSESTSQAMVTAQAQLLLPGGHVAAL